MCWIILKAGQCYLCGKMKRLALFETGLILVMALAVIAPGYAGPPTTIPPVTNTHIKVTNPLAKGMVLTLSGSGTAFNMADQSTHQSASISLTVKVEKTSFGRALLTVTGGTVNIGSESLTVDGGRGILNVHSGKLLLKVHLKDSGNRPMHLILFGKVNGQVPSKLDIGASFSLDFLKPQSKLAGRWFLELPGTTVTRTS